MGTYDNEAGYPLSHSLGTFFEWKYDVCELDEAVKSFKRIKKYKEDKEIQ